MSAIGQWRQLEIFIRTVSYVVLLYEFTQEFKFNRARRLLQQNLRVGALIQQQGEGGSILLQPYLAGGYKLMVEPMVLLGANVIPTLV